MPRDTLGRRNRFKRSPKGKRLVLGERDLDILHALYRYRYLRQHQLVALIRPRSKKRFIERLGDLYHETGLIGRPTAQWKCRDARSIPIIHEITSNGIDCLTARRTLPDRVTTLSRRHRPNRSVQFEHAMMIVDALFELELATIVKSEQRFVPVDEILARAPKGVRMSANPLRVPVTLKPCAKFPEIQARQETHLIPDGLYGIEYLINGEKRYRFWALECERTSPSSRSTIQLSSTAFKNASYDALIRSGTYRHHWGIPNLKLHLVRQPSALVYGD